MTPPFVLTSPDPVTYQLVIPSGCDVSQDYIEEALRDAGIEYDLTVVPNNEDVTG